MSDAAHRRRIRQAPPREGLERMAEAVGGPGTRVERVERLRGGLACATHAVRLSGHGWVVLKRSMAGARSLTLEHEALGVARAVATPTPEPLALDRDGEWFGRAALVMSRVPGRSHLHDGHPGPWLEDLAAATAAVHDAPLPNRLPAALERRHAWEAWDPPTPSQLRRSPLVERALAVSAALRADLAERPPARVLVHHDLHPGNVTWHRGRLAAVVDWNEARLGPAVADVAYCSVDLVASHGAAAADRFVDAYAAARGELSEDLPRWQVFWALNALRWLPHWRAGYVELGIETTLDTLRRRVRRFTADRLAALDA